MLRALCCVLAALLIGLGGCRRDEERSATAGQTNESDPAAKVSGDPTPAGTPSQDESDEPESSAKNRRKGKPGKKQTGDEPGQTRPDKGRRLADLGYLDFDEEEVDPEEGHGVVLRDEQRSYPGYNLYNSLPHNLAELIDADGNVIRSWTYEPSSRWIRCELLANGDLLVVGAGGMEEQEGRTRAERGYVMRLSWDGEVLWQRRMTAHHDIEMTPNDQILVLTQRRRSVPEFDAEKDIRDNRLTLLSPDGSRLEEHSLYDIFSASGEVFSFQRREREEKEKLRKKREERLKRKQKKAIDLFHGKAIDLFHANSVEWMPYPHLQSKGPIYASSNVIVCSRHQDTIAIINMEEKKLVWAWGQGEVSGPHEATFLENGNVLVFDNGFKRNWSRVIEVDPTTNQIVWEYKADDPEEFHSRARGTAQRLPNGNALVAYSEKGQAFEVTPDGETVWVFLNPHLGAKGGRATIRMKRYELSYVRGIMERFGQDEDDKDDGDS